MYQAGRPDANRAPIPTSSLIQVKATTGPVIVSCEETTIGAGLPHPEREKAEPQDGGQPVPQYEVDAPTNEILRWIKEDSGRKTPRLSLSARKEVSLETDFDRAAYGIGEDEDVELVSVRGTLEVQPRTGRRDWTLQLVLDDVMGFQRFPEETGYEDDDDMSFAAFEEQFLSKGLGEVEISVVAESADAKARFDRWLARRLKAAGS